jgi:pimeloyl-ACP methyl ester carboxylesterase
MNFDSFWHKNLGRPYKLHVVDHGGDGPVIVMLHGIAASSENWNKLVPLLSSEYRCITIDLVGFGKSPKPQWYDYTIEDHLRAIDHTIRKLRLKDSFTLVGHSLGSLIATRYTRDNPGRVSRIIPIPKSIGANPDIWIPFTRTLEHCIEQQTILEDITYLKLPIDIFYGSLDQLIISASIVQLAHIDGVTIHRLAVQHDITEKYAAGVAHQLLIPTPRADSP